MIRSQTTVCYSFQKVRLLNIEKEPSYDSEFVIQKNVFVNAVTVLKPKSILIISVPSQPMSIN